MVMETGCRLLLLLLAALGGARAMYEDQAGDMDWYRQYVGPVSWMAFDRSPQGSSKRLLLASESGVLAAVNTRTGAIIWRQVFEQGSGVISAVLHNELALMTVSHGAGRLRSWDPASGNIRWERAPYQPLRQPREQQGLPLGADWRPDGVLAVLTGKNTGSVIIATGEKVSCFAARSGEERWTAELDPDTVPCHLHVADGLVSVLSVRERSEMVVVQLDLAGGSPVKKHVLPAPWMNLDSTSCTVTGDTLACIEGSRLDLYTLLLGDSTAFTVTLLPNIGVPTNLPLPLSLTPSGSGNILLQSGHTHILLNHKGTVSMASQVSHAVRVDVMGEKGVGLDMLLVYGEGGVVLKCWDEGGRVVEELGGKVEVPENRGIPLQATAFVFVKSDGVRTYRMAVRMQDHTLIMLHPGRVAWVSEEALATVAMVEMLDLPSGQTETTERFVAMSQSEGNPLTLAAQRLQLQLLLAQEFVSEVVSRGLPALLPQEEGHRTRDQFNTRKIIVMATRNSKLYGLDSKTGEVMWQQFITAPSVLHASGSPLALHILRSTSHPPHPPLAVLLSSSSLPSCSGSLLQAFNPLTGELVTSDPICLPPVLQTLVVPVLDHTHSKTLLLLTNDLMVHAFPLTPQTATLLASLPEKLFFFATTAATGDTVGYQVNPGLELPFSTSPVWQLHFPTASERVVSVVSKPGNEPVSSLGRVKIDRSVQYKYLNPHLVAIVTESADSSKPFVAVYLVDSVSGGVVHHTIHKHASSPVHAMLSESWLVYHFYNSNYRRHEVAVLEMHETSTNQTHTVWSSLVPPPPPEVSGQAYAFLSPIHTIAATRTLRGITRRNILLGLHSGHIASLPKQLLDPRRRVEPTDEMKAEGLPPYVPEIALPPVRFINYNRTVTRLSFIHSCPSGLESTSLVLACGLDLFFARVQPSRQFDLLAEDFDYPLVAAVVLGLVATTFVLRHFSARKSLQALWK